MTHTPGPWHHGVSNPTTVWSGTQIASDVVAYCAHNEFAIGEQAANARLIAAAPEMLAALKAVEEWWLETGMKDALGAPYAIFAARAAVAKATGSVLAKET